MSVQTARALEGLTSKSDPAMMDTSGRRYTVILDEVD